MTRTRLVYLNSLPAEPQPARCLAHAHAYREMHEIFVVLSGQGLLHHDATAFRVGPGNCSEITPEEMHTFENPGREDPIIYFGIAPSVT